MNKFLAVLFIICVLVIQSHSEIAAPLGKNFAAEERRRNVERLSTLTHAYKESIPRFSNRDDVYRGNRIHNSVEHQVVFVIRQSNMEELTRILHDVSDPLSPNYGQHLSKSEVVELTSNAKSRNILESYLAESGALVTSETLGGEYVTASAEISVWEKMFDTEFFTFHQTQHDGKINRVVRAEKYSIPRDLEPHIESVFNTIQMPPQIFGDNTSPKIVPHDIVGSAYNFPGHTTPARIRAAYNVGTTKGSVKSTQGVFAAASQYYTPSDVSFFTSYFDGISYPLYASIGNHTSDTICAADTSSCDEATLDLQYIMSMSAMSPTTFWYTDQSFSRWLYLVANMASPPLVLSISYGTEESFLSVSEMSAFNTEAIKLSAMGVTIVAASGDDGAISRRVRINGASMCGYATLFPASSPYVTSVGGTSGVESGKKEVACQSDKGSIITSGGGFSTYYPQPDFQKAAVAGYFTAAAAAGTKPVSGYVATGRGYPDISLAALNYVVYIGGAFFGVSGTSASAPVIAAFFSNVNAARMDIGKGSLGWINPVLYSNQSFFVNDIVSGHNKCGASGFCCPQGFTAGAGWDPVTGLGSIDYAKLQNTLIKFGVAKSVAPTSSPTPTPTKGTFSFISVTQTLSGATSAQASTASFQAALQTAVSTHLYGQASVAMSSATGGARRILLTDVTLKYSVSIVSGMDSSALVTRFNNAVSSGMFLITLNQLSGLKLSLITNAVVFDATPTASPTSPPRPQGISSLYVTIGAALGAFILILVIIIIVRCCCCASLDAKSKVPPNPFKGEDPFCPPHGIHDDNMEKPYIYPSMCVITPYATVISRGTARNHLTRPPQAKRLANRFGLISNLKAMGIVNKPQERQGGEQEQEEEDEDCTPHQTIRGLSELHLHVQPASRDETVTDDSEGSVGAGWATGLIASRNSVTTRDFEESDEWLNNPRTP